jgi:hypothetical protein
MRLSPAARGVLAVLAAIVVSVAGEAAQPEPAAGITVAWDPNPEPNVAGYIVHVGEAPNQYQQIFDVGSRTSFTFAGALAGHRYHFAVSAYADGRLEGPLSNEVSAEATANTSNRRQSAKCAAAAHDCGSMEVLADGLAEIDALAALDDGRLLAIEGGRSVRVISTDGVPSHRPRGFAGGTRFGALAVDPRLIVLRLRRRDRRRTRGRAPLQRRAVCELNGALGEGAVIVSRCRSLAMATVVRRRRGQPHLRLDAGRLNAPRSVCRDGARASQPGICERNDRRIADSGSGYQNPSGISWDGATMERRRNERTPRVSAVASTLGSGAVDAIARSAIGVNGSDRESADLPREIGTTDRGSVHGSTTRSPRSRVFAPTRRSATDAVLFDTARLPARSRSGGWRIYAAVPGSAGVQRPEAHGSGWKVLKARGERRSPFGLANSGPMTMTGERRSTDRRSNGARTGPSVRSR